MDKVETWDEDVRKKLGDIPSAKAENPHQQRIVFALFVGAIYSLGTRLKAQDRKYFNANPKNSCGLKAPFGFSHQKNHNLFDLWKVAECRNAQRGTLRASNDCLFRIIRKRTIELKKNVLILKNISAFFQAIYILCRFTFLVPFFTGRFFSTA